MQDWKKTSQLARHWTKYNENTVECHLCPRHCKMKPGQMGFCKVRGNVNGELHTFNYGKSVTATEEVIETEACNHYMPGARILSLGNIGCMMACDYCQNWQTSQIKYLDPKMVNFYTPEQVVEMALKNDIKMLSWTYNDPVVWHEFVMDTAELGRKHGLKNLYKSAFYIEKEPVKELMEVMDIFSLSLKSMDPVFYRKYTKGELQPMLDVTKMVYDSGKHLEISQLLITERNGSDEDINKTVDWMLRDLGPEVPIHFVAFHPAFKYTHVERTPKDILLNARRIALEKGIHNVYIGNVYDEGMADTKCRHCENILVRRFGLTTTVEGINKDGTCKSCAKPSSIKFPHDGITDRKEHSAKTWPTVSTRSQTWDNEVKSLHLVLPHDIREEVQLEVHHAGTNIRRQYKLGGGNLSRLIISRATSEETGITVSWDKNIHVEFMPVLDRAHFPTSEDIAKAR
jgi:pyruvate formate lyase activating enzyme